MPQVFIDLLNKMNSRPSHISPSVYDTGWLAWLYPEAKDWLIETQRPDGSWGSDLVYYHDRVIATLSAINAIAATSNNKHELERVERGIRYIEQALPRVCEDVEETTAFELLLPQLVQIGRGLGLPLENIERLMAPIMPIYHQKMALIPTELIYSPHAVVAYSIEFMGFKNLNKAATPHLRAENGSIHNSPSATAFIEIATQGSPQGREYLDTLMLKYDGAVPGFTPLELFETIWTLHHFSLVTDLQTLRPTINPMINWLLECWQPAGVGFSYGFVPDPDDTALALRLLHRLGISVNPRVLEFYEEEDHFRCYPLERTISVDVHLHIIHALQELAGFPRKAELMTKALTILNQTLKSVSIVDKWHVSPYYSTAHAIISLAGFRDDLIQNQIRWLLNTQREDGRWTHYPAHPKAAIEETAHVLLALMTIYETNGSVSFRTIERGYRYLEKHYRCPEEIPAMWVNKGLYNPYHIVEAIILSVREKYRILDKGYKLPLRQQEMASIAL